MNKKSIFDINEEYLDLFQQVINYINEFDKRIEAIEDRLNYHERQGGHGI